MGAISRLLRCGTVSALLAATPAVWAQEPSADPGANPSSGPTREALEQSRATIRSINITVDNVFDPSNPDEDKALYRWANKVHVLTRDKVIQDMLLFAQGEPFVARLLDESARALRAGGFVADAVIEPGNYDPATNSVDVNVKVRDSWSLALEAKLNHKGGQTEWGIGLSDNNLLGTGKTLQIGYESEIDRDQSLLGYSDGNVFGSRARLRAVFANASDGHRRELNVERPFFSLDTRWAAGGSVHDEERVDTMYDLGEAIDEFHHDLEAFSVRGGWSRGAVANNAQRWLFGMASEEHKFLPTVDVPTPLLLPPDRKLVYPWLGWQWLVDDYREMTELNDMGRTEDVSLGLNLFASVGFAERRFGSDRDATLFELSAARGWEPGPPGGLLLLDGGASTRHEDSGNVNTQVYFNGHYYRRNLGEELLSVSLSVLATDALDAEKQVLLGGDNGLRGYPIRYQAGESRAVLNVEQRFFTDLYPWRLFRIGWAVFADLGRVSGRDPRASEPLGTLYDVGAGLRLTSPRASGRNVVHVDLAFPLNGDPSIDSVQFVIETKGSF
jgi:outer membrane protein assembly factor BamA